MRFCISIVKINAFLFMKQTQRFFLKILIKPCRRPAEYAGLIHGQTIVTIPAYSLTTDKKKANHEG